MAVSPQHIRDNQLSWLAETQKYIDAILLKHNSFPNNIYRRAGWKVEYISDQRDGNYLEFSA